MTTDDAKDKATEMARDRGEQLDDAVERVGAAVEDTVVPVADKVADKVVDVTGGMPDDPDKG